MGPVGGWADSYAIPSLLFPVICHQSINSCVGVLELKQRGVIDESRFHALLALGRGEHLSGLTIVKISGVIVLVLTPDPPCGR